MSNNTVKIVVPIPEDATMVSFAGIIATEDNVETITTEYDYEEIEEMKNEYLTQMAEGEEGTASRIVGGFMVTLTIILTFVLLSMLFGILVLWHWPDSNIALWIDYKMAKFFEKLDLTSALFSYFLRW